MTDYIGLIEGRLATSDAALRQVLSWLKDVRPGTPGLNGADDDIDAWRHGGSATLLAYHYGYANVKRWGDVLEEYRPDNDRNTGKTSETMNWRSVNARPEKLTGDTACSTPEPENLSASRSMIASATGLPAKEASPHANLLVPPPELDRSAGLFRGDPMPYRITPPPKRDMADLFGPPGPDSGFTARAGGPGGGSKSRASLSDLRTSAAPRIPAGNLNVWAGSPGRSPSQPASIR